MVFGGCVIILIQHSFIQLLLQIEKQFCIWKTNLIVMLSYFNIKIPNHFFRDFYFPICFFNKAFHRFR